MHTLTVHLWFNGNASEAITFYERAFGAKLAAPPNTGPEGEVLHAMLRIGDSHFMLADAMPGSERGPESFSTAGLWLYVEDCDGLYQRATENGCTVIYELMDAFWGDRMGKVRDPFGHCWAIATHKWDMSPEEIRQGQDAWLKSNRSPEP